MITFCRKCKINWAALHADARGDDDCEYCPVCLTDMFLEEGNSMTAYIMCPFSGKITDVDAGQELTREVKLMPLPRTPKAKPALKRTFAEWERLEDAGLEAYHKSGDPNDYFKAFNQKMAG